MEQWTATWGMRTGHALFLATFTMFLWLVVPVTAAGPAAAQTVQAGDGSVNFDFFIYLDNSSTIFPDGGGPNAPSRRIATMLQKLLESPFDDRSGRPFATTGDRIHLYRFDATVRPFGDPIDGGALNAWRAALEQFGQSQQKTGSERGPEVNPSKTNFVSLFRSIAEQRELQDTSGNRRQLVIIASDFVHDPNNNSGEVCAAARAFQLDKSVVPAKADMTLLASRTEQKLLTTGMKPFFVNLEYDVLTPPRQGEPQWVTCNRDMMRARPLTQALEADSRIKAATILFSQVADDTGRFVQEIRDSVYRAMLPALTLRSGTLQLTGGQQTLSLEMENRGRVDNVLRRASVYRGASDAATAALAETGQNFQPLIVRGGQVATLEIPLGGTVNPALFSNTEVFVSWSDDSAASAATPRRHRIPVKDEEPFELTNAARDTSDPTRVTLTVRNSQGGAKSVGRIAFRDAPTAPAIVLDSPDRSLVQPNDSLTIPSLPIPVELLRRIRAGGFELAVESGPTQRPRAWTSIRPANLAPVQVEPLPWTPQGGGNSLLLTAKLNNPNPFDVQVSRFVFLDGGGARLRQDCVITATEGLVEAGQSREMSCQIPATELANRSELTMRATDTRGDFLSGAVRLPSMRNNPLQLLSARLDLQRPGDPRVVAVVRNPDPLPNSVKSLIIRQKRGLPGNIIRLTPTDAGRQITVDSGTVEIGAALPPGALSGFVLNALQLRVVDLVPETEQRSPEMDIDTSGVTWPIPVGQPRLSGTRLDIDVQGQHAVPLTPLEIRLSTTSSGESSTTLRIKEPRATAENQPQSLSADITHENQLALLSGSEVYACISSVREFEPSANAAIRPCDMARIVRERPKANIVVGLDRSQNGLAYIFDKQSTTPYRLLVNLTNNGDWAGRASSIRLLPSLASSSVSVATRENVFPLENQVDVPAKKTIKAAVRLSREQWIAYVSSGRIRYGEMAIATGREDEEALIEKNDLVEDLFISANGAWMQKNPVSNHEIVVGIAAKLTRQNSGQILNVPISIQLFNNLGEQIHESSKTIKTIKEGEFSDTIWTAVNWKISPDQSITSRPETFTISIPGNTTQPMSISPSIFSPLRTNLAIAVGAAFFLLPAFYWIKKIEESRINYMISSRYSGFFGAIDNICKEINKSLQNSTMALVIGLIPQFVTIPPLIFDGLYASTWFSVIVIATFLYFFFAFFAILQILLSGFLEKNVGRKTSNTIQHEIKNYAKTSLYFSVILAFIPTIISAFALIPIESDGIGSWILKTIALNSIS